MPSRQWRGERDRIHCQARQSKLEVYLDVQRPAAVLCRYARQDVQGWENAGLYLERQITGRQAPLGERGLPQVVASPRNHISMPTSRLTALNVRASGGLGV